MATTTPVVLEGENGTKNVVIIEYGKSDATLDTYLRVGADLTDIDKRPQIHIEKGELGQTVKAVLTKYTSEETQRKVEPDFKPAIAGAREKLQHPKLLVQVNGQPVRLESLVRDCLGLRVARVYQVKEGGSESPVYVEGVVNPEKSGWEYLGEAKCNFVDFDLTDDKSGGAVKPQTKDPLTDMILKSYTQ